MPIWPFLTRPHPQNKLSIIRNPTDRKAHVSVQSEGHSRPQMLVPGSSHSWCGQRMQHTPVQHAHGDALSTEAGCGTLPTTRATKVRSSVHVCSLQTQLGTPPEKHRTGTPSCNAVPPAVSAPWAGVLHTTSNCPRATHGKKANHVCAIEQYKHTRALRTAGVAGLLRLYTSTLCRWSYCFSRHSRYFSVSERCTASPARRKATHHCTQTITPKRHPIQ
jgi:hypothetical protein